MASQMDIPYFLGLLYLMLQYQDKASSSFKLSGISVDSNSFSPPFTNGSDPGKNYRLTPKEVLRTFVHPFLSALPEASTVEHQCFYGKSWNKSVCISCTPQSCFERFGGLDAQDKCSLLSESDLESSSTSSNAKSCKKFSNYFALIFFLVVILFTTLRWKTFSKAKRKLNICSESSTTHVFSTSKTIWGSLFVLLTLSDSGNSSSIASNTTVSSKDTTVYTPWTSKSIPRGSANSLTPMPSSSSFDAIFTSSQTSNQTTQNSFSKGGNHILGISSNSSLESTESTSAVSRAVVTSSVYLSVSDSQTALTLNPGNSLAMETVSFKSSYMSPSITLDTNFTSVSSYPVQSHLISTNVENTFSVSNEYFTSTSAFIEGSSPLKRTTDVTVSQIRSTSMAPHMNESPTHSVSGVKSPIFTTKQGLPSMHGLGSSVASLTRILTAISTSDYQANTTMILSVRSTSKLFSSPPPSTQSSSSSTSLLSSTQPFLTRTSTTISTSDYQKNTTMISSVISTSKLFSSPPSSTQSSSSSSTSLLSSTQPFLSSHESSSASTLSSPLESSPPSFQFPLTSLIVDTTITNFPSLSSSSLSSALLIILPSSSSSGVNVYTTPLLSPTTAPQASTSLSSSLSSSSSSSVPSPPFLLLLTSASISPSSSLPRPSSSLSPSSSPASSPSPLTSLPLPSLLSSSPSPSPPTSSGSLLPSPSLPRPLSSSSSSPASSPSPLPSLPLPSLSPSSSLSPSPPTASRSPLPSLLSSSPTSPSPPLSHSSLSSPSSSLLPSSLSLRTLTPSATALPPFSSASLLATSKALGSTVLEVSAPLLTSSIFLRWSNSSQQQTWSSLESLMTVNFTSPITNQVMVSVTFSETPQETLLSSVTSSIAHIPPTTSPQDGTRIINVTVSLINEEFHSDLSNESSAKFMNLSQRVNSTLWELFSPKVEGLKEIRILQFSKGSVKVVSELLVSNSSNITAQVINQTLLNGNGTNNNGFIFSEIDVKETCTPGYCMNSGSCQERDNGAICSCSGTGFVGSRCAQVPAVVNGNYTEWSEFTECSKTCDGGQRSRRRTCTNPTPQNGGKDCAGLGRDIENADCNGDVRCPVSAEIWIAVGIACGVFLLILILALLFFLRRRRKRAEQRNGSKDFYSNGHSTMIPLEVIYEDKTMPKSSPKGNLNPEFIGDDDDDNDIYKAQLLLFLKQSHLIRPNIYPDEQDNKSDTSDYSRKNSRKVSAVSTASDNKQEDNDEPTVDVESAQEPDNQSAGQTKQGEKVLQSTEL